jgi:peptidoglycan/LPS O-acetylase OafA/YrhL
MAVAGRRALIIGTAAALGAVGAVLIGTGWSQPAGVPLVMAAIIIAALEASVAARPPLAGRTALWLGAISYALYLSHFFLWILFKIAFVGDPANVPPLAIAGYVALTLAVSHALHRWVELPGRRWFQRGGEMVMARRSGAVRA